MKRLPAAPLTDEDDEIWHEHVLTERLDPYYEGLHLWQYSQTDDRRDADRMSRILYRGCRFCGEPPHVSLYDVLHLRTCVYATTGARLIIYEGQR
jgi:hypothetical protein